MAISIDSTLKQILECPEATAVVEKYSPGFSKNPMLKMAYGMKLSACVKFPQGGVKPEDVPKLADDLKALGI